MTFLSMSLRAAVSMFSMESSVNLRRCSIRSSNGVIALLSLSTNLVKPPVLVIGEGEPLVMSRMIHFKSLRSLCVPTVLFSASM